VRFRIIFTLALLAVFTYSAADASGQTAGPQINEIHMLDARRGWAWTSGLGGHRHLLRTINGAQTWRDVTPDAYPYTEEGSCFRDAQIAWVPIWNRTNYASGLLHTIDGGKSWTLLTGTNSPVFSERSDCRFYNATYGVAQTSDGGLGSAYYNYFETRDGGKTWKPIPLHPRDPDFSSGASPFTFHLSNICEDRMAFNPPGTLIIAYGDMGDEKPKGAVRISVSSDSGKNWRDLSLPLPAEFQAALSTPGEPVFFDAHHAVLDSHLVKENANDSHAYDVVVFYASRDGGKNWELQPAVLRIDPNSWTDKVMAFAMNNIFVQADESFYVSHDGAKSWQKVTPNIAIGARAKREVLELDFVNQQLGWMIISDNIAMHPDGNYILYKTADGGKTWAEVPVRVAN